MFSKLVEYIWNPDRSDPEEENELASSNGSSVENEKFFEGTVTDITIDHGLIDHEVYFDRKITHGDYFPRVGDAVRVIASRIHSSAGWKATHVSQVHAQKEETDLDLADNSNHTGQETNLRKETKRTVSEVKFFRGEKGFLVGNIPFRIEDCLDEFLPYEKDWVSCVINTDVSTSQQYAFDIKPLREYNFDGKVTSFRYADGYINGDVFFTSKACERGFTPKVGDRVCGKAVENGDKKRNSWRALSVIPVTGNLVDQHLNASVLQSPVQLKSLAALCANKEGVEVTSTIDFGRIQISNGTRNLDVWIKNGGAESQTLAGVAIRCGSASQFRLRRGEPCVQHACSVTVQPRSTAKYTLYCKPTNLGAEKQLLVFDFGSFSIGRQVTVHVTDPQQVDLVTADPYVRRQQGYSRYKAAAENPHTNWLIPGQKPSGSSTNIRLPQRLAQFPVPQSLRDAYVHKDDLTHVLPQLTQDLSMENYTEKFKALLHLEEIQQDISIRDFDMERVILRPVGELLALEVPGLSEGLPSVIVGDSVILSDVIMPENSPEYQGYVHEVLRDEVLLKLQQQFHDDYRGEDYNVRFLINRVTFRRGHQAVEFAPRLGTQVLFPEGFIPKAAQKRVTKAPSYAIQSPQSAISNVGVRKGPTTTKAKPVAEGFAFINKRLNTRQKAAVIRILNGQCRPTPYIIFGPPGTGKTITVVEAVLQIFTQLSSSRILLCAPSNSAADLLAQRIHSSGHIDQADMARLNAYTRGENSIAPALLPFCFTSDDLQHVSRHRIVVCTCTTAGKLYELGLSPGHFTHVFVDEAGQATEPDCMIPVGLAAGKDGQIVLAGDPMQLGPVLKSKHAVEYGLGQSFLERLINMPLYQRDEQKFADHGSYDPLLVTKLVENYRSHAAIITTSSRLFYHEELRISGEREMIECFCAWQELPNTAGFPVIFHGVRGEDRREGNNPSWFNPAEAIQVMKYLQLVLGNTVHPVTAEDIGIITPYRKQVEKIRLLMDKLDIDKVKVGSVEEFQGQERLVMIISTVRSQEEHVGGDVRNSMGFLSNPKRFNVSVTRAQALLLIIGNPHILDQDPMWRELLSYCVEHNAYIGCDLPHMNFDLVTKHTSPKDSPPKRENKSMQMGEEALESQTVDVLTSQELEDKEFGSLSPSVLSNVQESPNMLTNDTQTSGGVVPHYVEPRGPDVSLIGSEGNPNSCQETMNFLENEHTRTDKTEEKTAVESAHQEFTMKSLDFKADNSSYMYDAVDQKVEACKNQEENLDNIDYTSPSDKQYSIEGQTDATTKLFNCGSNSVASRLISHVPYSEALEETHGTTFGENIQPSTSPILNAGIEYGLNDRCSRELDINTPHDVGDKQLTAISMHTQLNNDTLSVLKGISVDKYVWFPSERDFIDKNVNPNSEITSGQTLEEVIKRKHISTELPVSVIQTYPGSPVKKKNQNRRKSESPPKQTRQNKKALTQETCHKTTASPTKIHEKVPERELRNTTNALSTTFHSKLHKGKVFNQSPKTESNYQAAFQSNVNQNDSFEETTSVRNSANMADTNTQSSSIIAKTSATEMAGPYGLWGNRPVIPPSLPLSTPQIRPSPLEKEIIRQMEYYFGDINLVKDVFLKDYIAQDRDGWVPLKVLVTFKKMQALSTDFEVICCALEKSVDPIIDVHESRDRVRRSTRRPLPEHWDDWKHGMYERAIVLEGVTLAMTREDLQEELEARFGAVEHVERGIHKLREGKQNRGISQVELLIFKSSAALDSLPRSGTITLLGKPVRMYCLDNFTQQCVEYFYRKRVLGRRHVKPVRFYHKSYNTHHQKDSTTYKVASEERYGCRDSRPATSNISLNDSDSVDHLIDDTGFTGGRHVKPVQLSHKPSNTYQNDSQAYEVVSEESLSSRDGGPSTLYDSDSVDHLIDGNNSLQAKLLRCLDDDGITFVNSKRKPKKRDNPTSEAKDCDQRDSIKPSSSINNKVYAHNVSESVSVASKHKRNIEVANARDRTQTEKEKLSLARRNLWMQAHANASGDNKSNVPNIQPEISDTLAKADSVNTSGISTGTVMKPSTPDSVLSPDVVETRAGGIMTSSPMRGVQQPGAYKRGVGRGIRTLKMLVAKKEKSRENSPTESNKPLLSRGKDDDSKCTSPPKSNANVCEDSSDKQRPQPPQAITEEIQSKDDYCSEDPLIHQEGDKEFIIRPAVARHEPLDVEFMEQLMQIAKENQEYFDSCAKASDENATKEDRKNEAAEESFPFADDNTGELEGEMSSDPLMTCDISPIVPSEQESINSDPLTQNYSSLSQKQNLTDKLSKENTNIEYSSFIYSTGSSAENTTDSGRTLQSANKSGPEKQDHFSFKYKHTGNNDRKSNIHDEIVENITENSKMSGQTGQTSHSTSGSTVTEILPGFNTNIPTAGVSEISHEVESIHNADSKPDTIDIEKNQNVVEEINARKLSPKSHSPISPFSDNNLANQHLTKSPTQAGTSHISAHQFSPKSPVQVNFVAHTENYEDNAGEDSPYYWGGLEQEDGDVVVEEEEDIDDTDDECETHCEPYQPRQENWT